MALPSIRGSSCFPFLHFALLCPLHLMTYVPAALGNACSLTPRASLTVAVYVEVTKMIDTAPHKDRQLVGPKSTSIGHDQNNKTWKDRIGEGRFCLSTKTAVAAIPSQAMMWKNLESREGREMVCTALKHLRI